MTSVSSRAAQTARDLAVAIYASAKYHAFSAVKTGFNAEAIERLRGPSARFASLGMTRVFKTLPYGTASGFGPAFSFKAWVNSCRPETICGAFVRTVLASFSE